MPDKGNDISARQTGKHRIPRENVFGTPEEIKERVGGSLNTLSDNRPSTFRQIGPQGGGSFDDKRPTSRSGDQKFGNARKYA